MSTNPQRGRIAWADLLRVTAHLPRAQWADAALALGAQWVGAPAPAAADQAPAAITLPLSALGGAPAPVAWPAPQAQMPQFWRVASSSVAPADKGTEFDWLAQPLAQPAQPGETLFDSAGSMDALPPPLIPSDRLATLLRSHLVAGRTTGELDWAWLIPRLARLQMPSHWRLRRVPRWPRSIHIVWQDTPQLRAVQSDLSFAARQACQLLGSRARLLRAGATPDTAVFEADNRPLHAAQPADSTVVFGLADPPGQQAWRRWAEQRASSAGRPPLLIATAPARLLAAATPEAFRVLVCDDIGQAVSLGAEACAMPAGAGQPLPESSPDAAQSLPADPAVRLLCAAIAGCSRVPLAALRAVRRRLADAGAPLDLGHDIALLADTARVVSDRGACALRRGLQPAALQTLRQMPAAWQRIAVLTLWQGHQGLPPTTRATYALSLMTLGLPADTLAALQDDLFQAALAWPAQLAKALAQGQGGGVALAELDGFVRGLADRRPDLLAAHGALATAWVIAARHDLLAGRIAPPAWVRPEHLQLLNNPAVAQPAIVRVVGADLILAPAGAGLPALASVHTAPLWAIQPEPDAPHQRRAAALQALPEARLLALLNEHGRNGSSQPDPDTPAGKGKAPADHPATLVALLAQLAGQLTGQPERWALELDGGLRRLASQQNMGLALMLRSLDEALGLHRAGVPAATTEPGSAPLPLPAGGDATLQVGRHRLGLQAFTRLPWADALHHTATGWWATLADGRRLRWMPQAALPVQAGQGQAHYTPAQGFWWDAAEAEANFFAHGGQLRQPDWAARHGVDEFGWWAEFYLSDDAADTGRTKARAMGLAKIQPPHSQRLRFIPPGRFWMGSPLAEAGRDENETLHPVTLTRGLWLADTPCGAALWQAVTGDAGKTAATDGAGQPLPMVNISHDDITWRFLPALARRLPGFEARLPTEAEWEHAARAGSTTAYPWGDEADNQRMNIGADLGPLRAYQRNAFGLWQMHGNVWQWCADGYGPLASVEAVDPLPPEAAWRVLRGGCWLDGARSCRSAVRYRLVPGERSRDIGFRLARGLPQAPAPAGGARPAEPVAPQARAADVAPLPSFKRKPIRK